MTSRDRAQGVADAAPTPPQATLTRDVSEGEARGRTRDKGAGATQRSGEPPRAQESTAGTRAGATVASADEPTRMSARETLTFVSGAMRDAFSAAPSASPVPAATTRAPPGRRAPAAAPVHAAGHFSAIDGGRNAAAAERDGPDAGSGMVRALELATRIESGSVALVEEAVAAVMAAAATPASLAESDTVKASGAAVSAPPAPEESHIDTAGVSSGRHGKASKGRGVGGRASAARAPAGD